MQSANAIDAELSLLIDKVFRSFPIDNPAARLATLECAAERKLFAAALAYLRGDFKTAIASFYEADDDAARLIACCMAFPAAIDCGNWTAYQDIETYLKRSSAHPSPSVSGLAQRALAFAYIGGLAPQLAADFIKTGDLASLPAQARFAAAVQRADYLFGMQNFEGMLLVTQTCLDLSEIMISPGETSADVLYLMIENAVAHLNLGNVKRAEEQLLRAMSVALPNGFITPFAERIVTLGGLVEPLLKKHYPDWYDPVMDLAESVLINWVTVINWFRTKPLLPTLTIQESELAHCAAQGHSAAELAKRFHLSVHTVNNKMSTIYDKLNIRSRTPRKDLAELILSLPERRM